MTRAVILSLTIAALIMLWTEPAPPPPKVAAVTPYCVIDYLAAQRHPLTGEWVTGWAKGWGPCKFLDRYEYI